MTTKVHFVNFPVAGAAMLQVEILSRAAGGKFAKATEKQLGFPDSLSEYVHGSQSLMVRHDSDVSSKFLLVNFGPDAVKVDVQVRDPEGKFTDGGEQFIHAGGYAPFTLHKRHSLQVIEQKAQADGTLKDAE